MTNPPNESTAARYTRQIEQAIGFFGREHDVYLNIKAHHIQRAIARHLGNPAQSRLLDVGCGVGLMDRALAPHVGAIYGVDITAEAVAAARNSNPTGIYSVYDGATLPFRDDTFDVSIVVNVLHHVPIDSRARVLTEIARTLRPGGLCMVAEHNSLNPLTRRVVSTCEFDHDAVLLRPVESRDLLGTAGFEVVEQRSVVFLPTARRWALALDQWLGWLPIGAQYLIVGRRAR